MRSTRLGDLEPYRKLGADVEGVMKAWLSDDRLPMPHIHGRTAENIGAFMVAWGILERELDGAFHILFHTDATLAACLYSNLGTKAKLDILKSAITMLSAVLGKQLTRRCHKILEDISSLSDKARTTIAHGQLKYFLDEDTEKYTWELVRHVARKNPAVVVHPGTPRYWLMQEGITLRYAQKWRSCVLKIYPKLDHLTLDDLENICLAQIRESEPSYANSRKRPPQPKPGSVGRQTRLAKWPRR